MSPIKKCSNATKKIALRHSVLPATQVDFPAIPIASMLFSDGCFDGPSKHPMVLNL
jgi:hypothetical protein